MKVAIPLAKNVLGSLGTTEAASASDAGIQNKRQGFQTATLIISNKEINGIMTIVQALEDSNIIVKGVTKTIKNITKKQKGGFLSILLGTLRASLLGKLLSGKGIIRAGPGNKKVNEIIRAGYGKEWVFNTASSFKKIEMQKYYENEPRLYVVFSRDNIPKNQRIGHK